MEKVGEIMKIWSFL